MATPLLPAYQPLSRRAYIAAAPFQANFFTFVPVGVDGIPFIVAVTKTRDGEIHPVDMFLACA